MLDRRPEPAAARAWAAAAVPPARRGPVRASARPGSRLSARGGARSTGALCLGVRDYVRKNRFQQRGHGHERRHRLRAHRLHRRRRPRHGEGQRRLHALALLERRHQERRPGDAPNGWASTSRRSPSRSVYGAYLGTPRAQLRRRPARGHRAEHPGPHPRQPADGALEQVRLAGADHRQQERDGRRLRDALRRHGRRFRGAQGRPQDAGLPAGRLPQLARSRARAHPARPPSTGPPRPSWPPIRPTRTRCRPTSSSTGSSRPTWCDDESVDEIVALGHRPDGRSSGWWA